MPEAEIVLFGDSLTEWGFFESTSGYGWALERAYSGKAKVRNEGKAGFTSRSIQRDFDKIIAGARQPDSKPILLFTIFLGANDACFVSKREALVPIDEYERNLRRFVDTILAEPRMEQTKIVLITPPPINIPDPQPEDDERGIGQGSRGYATYMNKKRYAEKVMEIAESYESTGKVVGLNFWKALIDSALKDQGRLGHDDAYDDERLPGCGTRTAIAFRRGYFEDGLHFDSLSYEVLTEVLSELFLQKWPDLAPDQIKA